MGTREAMMNRQPWSLLEPTGWWDFNPGVQLFVEGGYKYHSKESVPAPSGIAEPWQVLSWAVTWFELDKR